jgi:sugar lactone lactonase YvrE
VASYAAFTISSLAGSGAPGWADGVGAAAQFNSPCALAVAPLTALGAAPLLVVADQSGNAIRAISLPSGGVSTLLRSPGGACGFVDGVVGGFPAPALCAPSGVTLDAAGTIFIADRSNHAIRALSPGGALRTLVGAGVAGYVDGPGATALLRNPRGIALAADESGALLIADSDNNMVRAMTCAPGIVVAAVAVPLAPYSAAAAAAATAPPALAAALAGTTVSTLAGNGTQCWGDGPGPTSCLNRPWGIAFNATSGIALIVDQWNKRVRALSPEGVLSTVSGSGGAVTCSNGAAWNNPTGCALEPSSGLLLVADYNCAANVRRVLPNGTTASVGATTVLSGASGVTVGGDGVIYVAHRTTHRVLALAASDTAYSVLAGGSSSGFSDAPGTSALFSSPTSIALDPLGNLLVADTSNDRIRMVHPNSARVFTLAGRGTTGFLDGPATSAQFNSPQGVFCFFSLTSAVIVADSGNHAIRHISPLGYVSTLAGASGVAGYADGPGITALFTTPRGLAFRTDGALLVTDMGSYIRLLSKATFPLITGGLALAATPPPPPTPYPNWVLPSGCAAGVSTLAGTPTVAGSTNGASGTASSFNAPFGLAVDSIGGVLWVADQNNRRLRKVLLSTGATSAVVGNAAGFLDGYGTSGLFSNPTGLTVDPASGSPPWVYVADFLNSRVRRMAPDGLLSTYAGTTSGVPRGGAAQVSAIINRPLALAFAQNTSGSFAGALFVADRDSHVLMVVLGGGQASILAGRAGLAGLADGVGSAALLNMPTALASGPNGTAFFADRMNNAIRSATLPGGAVLTLCGTLGAAGFDDGPCLGGAHFKEPQGLAYDFNTTALFVGDTGNNAVRMILKGWVSTLAGGGGPGGAFADGPGAHAAFNAPRPLALDS